MSIDWSNQCTLIEAPNAHWLNQPLSIDWSNHCPLIEATTVTVCTLIEATTVCWLKHPLSIDWRNHCTLIEAITVYWMKHETTILWLKQPLSIRWNKDVQPLSIDWSNHCPLIEATTVHWLKELLEPLFCAAAEFPRLMRIFRVRRGFHDNLKRIFFWKFVCFIFLEIFWVNLFF